MKVASLLKLFVPALFALTLAPLSTAQANLAGDWNGTLDAGGNIVHVAWRLTIAPDGAPTSTLDNIDEGVYGIKVKSTTIKGSDVALSVDDTVQANGQDLHLLGSFAGKVSADSKEVTGTWTQVEPQQGELEVRFVHAAQTAAPAAAPPTASSSPQASVLGDWSGTLQAGPAQLRLILHIKTNADGTLTGTLDSIDQGANGIPISTVSFKDGKLELNVAAVNGTYEGTVDKDDIKGTWTQGQALELNFKRGAPQAAAASKPAAPIDIDGTWTGKLSTPGGSLTINLKVANMDSGLTAQIQSPDQSPNWAPATSISREGNQLSVTFNAFGATYKGKIAADHSSIGGQFTQMGNDLPLVLKKI
ncbi:hypothetical protein [Occallatibacter savannae]|uniref:hypothetical protein n=1 Tax=Occallatibacter savannae TaxID=1002691 RepID=UPI000D69AED3|nr:hypothetical protein [Occallatibacter savannae]